jgi:tetratricopeptide (TPR) repeat protein
VSSVSSLSVRDFHKEDYATLYSNRAACRNKLGDCQGCISDCDEGLSYNSNNLKLYLRKAAALESLEKFALAYVNYRAALSLDSNVPQAHQACSRQAEIVYLSICLAVCLEFYSTHLNYT